MLTAILFGNQCIAQRATERLRLLNRTEIAPVISDAASMTFVSRIGLPYRAWVGLDRQQLAKSLEQCEVVIHCGAEHGQDLVQSVSTTYSAAQDAGVRRMIYISSLFIHDIGGHPTLDESLDLFKTSPFNAIIERVKAETRLKELRASGSVELIVLRPGIVFGPRSVWTIALANELLSKTASLVDGGSGICNTTYVDNLVHSLEICLTASSDADGKAFFIVDDEELTWLDFYQPFARALGISLSEIKTAKKSNDNDSMLSSLVQSRSKNIQSKMPAPLRRLAKSIFSGPGTAGQTEFASPFEKMHKHLPEETRLLQTHNLKASSRKAKSLLGFEPVVPFTVACQRSIGWLQFAHYPVTDKEI